jgi:hypothetical protein
MLGNTDGEGPRNVISSTATKVADPTTDPRWGTVDTQKIVDEGRRRAFELQDHHDKLERIAWHKRSSASF